jgi:hypothetical protein
MIQQKLFLTLVAEFCSQSVLLSQTGRLNFQKFDMSKVLASDTHLMASEGKEYDVEEEHQGIVSGARIQAT